MPKLSEEARQLRYETLIRFIREHQPVKGAVIYNTLYNGARQSFTDDKNRINRNGEIIVREKGGYCIREHAEPSGAAADVEAAGERFSKTSGRAKNLSHSHEPALSPTRKLTPRIIRHWCILYILSMGRYESSFRDQEDGYSSGSPSDRFHARTGAEECLCEHMEEEELRVFRGDLVSVNPPVYGLRFQILQRELQRRGFPCDKNTLYSDLKELMSTGLVNRTDDSSPLYYSTAVCETDRHRVREYGTLSSRTLSGHSRLKLEAHEAILRQIRVVLPAGSSSLSDAEVLQIGKKVRLTQNQTNAVEKLEQINGLRNALDLYYAPASETGTEQHHIFYSGIMVYSVETTRLYLLGYTKSPDTGKRNETILDVLRIDFSKTRSLKERIPESVGTHFRQIYKEMFGISVEPPRNVRVRVSNQTFLLEKFRRLKEVREADGNHPEFFPDPAFVQSPESPGSPDWIYTDRIRGLENFARYLRGFGRGVIAEAPSALVNRMQRTNRHLIALYKDQ